MDGLANKKGLKQKAHKRGILRRAKHVMRELAALSKAIQDGGTEADSGAECSKQEYQIAIPSSLQESAIEAGAAALIRALKKGHGAKDAKQEALLSGRVYCYRCRSISCAHAELPDTRQTFWKYSATGTPQWISLTNLCIQRGDSRVDRLYDERPEVIAIYRSAGELCSEMDGVFSEEGKNETVYGQVTAGLIPTKHWLNGAVDGRFVLTVQVLRTAQGRCRLNVMGLTNPFSSSARTNNRAPTERLRRSLRKLKTKPKDLDRKNRQSESSELYETQISAYLKQLAKSIERSFRLPRQRTRHAHGRHLGGERPTSTALIDALSAPVERLLHDIEKDTVVVLGPKGRAHLFSSEGKHVTSLKLRPGEVDRKNTQKRWLLLSRDKAMAWQARLQGKTMRR